MHHPRQLIVRFCACWRKKSTRRTYLFDLKRPLYLKGWEPKLKANDCPDNQKFKVRCHAGDWGNLELASDSVLVQIEQRVRREGKEEMWVSLQVKCDENEDGSLAVQVVICNPDWDEPLRIASIQSNPKNGCAPAPILRCDLEQKEL